MHQLQILNSQRSINSSNNPKGPQLDIHLFFTPHIPSPPGSARWAHRSLPVTLPEESKLATTRLSSSQVRTTRVLSPSGFFYFKKTSVVLRRSWVAKDFAHWDHSTQDIISSFMALTNEAERTLDLPRHGAARACPWLSTALVAGSVRRGRGGDRYSQRRSESEG